MTAEELHLKIYNKGIIEKWLNITVERFQKKIDKLKIGSTGELAHSFKKSQTADKAKIEFNYYGRFVDMGAGRGQKANQVKENRSINAKALGIKSARRPKKWYSPTIAGQIKKLTEILASECGRDAAEYVRQNLTIPVIIEI